MCKQSLFLLNHQTGLCLRSRTLWGCSPKFLSGEAVPKGNHLYLLFCYNMILISISCLHTYSLCNYIKKAWIGVPRLSLPHKYQVSINLTHHLLWEAVPDSFNHETTAALSELSEQFIHAIFIVSIPFCFLLCMCLKCVVSHKELPASYVSLLLRANYITQWMLIK